MSIEINELKQVRRKIGITQTELAKKSGVSQSLIAKIESGKLDPTYSKAQQILQAVEYLSGDQEAVARELMQKRIISVRPTSTVKEVIKKLKGNEISQMPVIENQKAVGHISESVLLTAMLDGRPHDQVQEIMKDAPPTISPSTGSSVVSDLLKHFSLILVAEKGRLQGVITKADVLQKLYR